MKEVCKETWYVTRDLEFWLLTLLGPYLITLKKWENI